MKYEIKRCRLLKYQNNVDGYKLFVDFLCLKKSRLSYYCRKDNFETDKCDYDYIYNNDYLYNHNNHTLAKKMQIIKITLSRA